VSKSLHDQPLQVFSLMRNKKTKTIEFKKQMLSENNLLNLVSRTQEGCIHVCKTHSVAVTMAGEKTESDLPTG